MWKWIVVIVAILVGLLAFAVLAGALLPRTHVATRAAHFRQPPAIVWQAITDYEQFPSWRPGVKSVERMPGKGGLPAWVEHSGAGWQAQRLPIEVVDSRPPEAGGSGHLVTRIADPKLPFGGTWTYNVVPASGGTLLRITENGVIDNTFFRFMARFVLGYRTTIDEYLKALGRKFGEEIQLEG